MNRKRLLVLALVASGFAQAQPEAQPASRPMRDAASHDALSQSLRMAQQADPIRNTGPAIGEADKDPSLLLAGRDLVKDSAIFCFQGRLTLVPKTCVLHLPETLKARFEATPGAKVVPWADFYRQNQGWIRTLEVSQEQAMGQAPLSEEAVAAFETSSSVVVATFQGGPISVRPYTPPSPESSAAGGNTGN
ncbi:MAG TPA: hypothetical protein PLA50_00245 [Bacteroidia bacterium]|nr:hypothetical protein [Bacteroidia bacterium]